MDGWMDGETDGQKDRQICRHITRNWLTQLWALAKQVKTVGKGISGAALKQQALAIAL